MHYAEEEEEIVVYNISIVWFVRSCHLNNLTNIQSFIFYSFIVVSSPRSTLASVRCVYSNDGSQTFGLIPASAISYRYSVNWWSLLFQIEKSRTDFVYCFEVAFITKTTLYICPNRHTKGPLPKRDADVHLPPRICQYHFRSAKLATPRHRERS